LLDMLFKNKMFYIFPMHILLKNHFYIAISVEAETEEILSLHNCFERKF